MNLPPLAPYRPAGSSFYDAAVAKVFFESCGRAETIAAGTTLFVENEKSTAKNIFTKPINADLFSKPIVHRMYFLTTGEVELTASGKRIDIVGPGDVFGEMAVISEIDGHSTSSLRSATAVTRTDCTGYSLDGAETEAGLHKTPEFALMLMSLMFERLRLLAARLATRDTAKAKLSSNAEPVFDAPTLAALEEKLERATTVRFDEGRQIMKEGHPGSTMYIVLEGRVAISIDNKIVEKLGPGGVFGEMALVDQSPRTASAVALADCALLSLNRNALIALVKSDPSIGMAMMRCVADRMRYMNSLFT
ncbi:MAG: cyclic nucleotide-binding domain-containing protein [Usitatibacteraceae bacterium]